MIGSLALPRNRLQAYGPGGVDGLGSNAVKGAVAGAASGAVAGSVVPVYGTIALGIVGGAQGYMSGKKQDEEIADAAQAQKDLAAHNARMAAKARTLSVGSSKMLWIIGGVAVLGVGTWLVMRRRR